MKRIFCLLLSISFVFSNWMTVFASNEVQPRAYSYPCDYCNGMVVRQVIQLDMLVDYEHPTCKHGKNGTDLYSVYCDFYRDVCHSCWRSTDVYLNYYSVFSQCQGT